MFSERLLRARKASGLSMKALGDAAGVSNTMIKKYEHGESMPSSKVLIGLSKALSVRTEYFFRSSTISLETIEYRKRSGTPQKTINKIKADFLDQAERWFELKNLWPNFPIKSFNYQSDCKKIECIENIENLAIELREKWDLGSNALPNLIDLLESKGILVICTESEHANKVDGLQTTVEKQPVIVISTAWPGCRQRFTLAHELGHLILEDINLGNIDEEKACNRFSGALLLPQTELINILGPERKNISWKEMLLIKQEYGISMQAVLYRCKDLKIINEHYHTSMSIEFSKRGWRKTEPGDDYPQEKTLLFKQLIHRAASEEIISMAKAAELLGVSVSEFRKQRMVSGLIH